MKEKQRNCPWEVSKWLVDPSIICFQTYSCCSMFCFMSHKNTQLHPRHHYVKHLRFPSHIKALWERYTTTQIAALEIIYHRPDFVSLRCQIFGRLLSITNICRQASWLRMSTSHHHHQFFDWWYEEGVHLHLLYFVNHEKTRVMFTKSCKYRVQKIYGKNVNA